jgi:spermidine synthase
MPINLKQLLLSYIWGVHVEKVPSRINGELNVYYIKGKYLLNATQANYSYGALHKGFRKIFRKIKLKKQSFSNVLLLGFGSGSVVSIIHEEYKMNCRITAVELDPIVLTLGNKYFNIKRFENLKIVTGEAFDFVKNTKEKFDLIVFDIYIDTDIPPLFESMEFLESVKNILSENGLLVYNKDINSEKMKESLDFLNGNFSNVFPSGRKLKIGRKNYFFVNR